MKNRKAKILLAQKWKGGKYVELRISNNRYGRFLTLPWGTFVQKDSEEIKWRNTCRGWFKNRGQKPLAHGTSCESAAPVV